MVLTSGLAALAVLVAACGGAPAAGGAASPSGSLDGAGKEIVFFGLTDQVAYNRLQNEAVQEQAKQMGFTYRAILTPQLDQTVQDGLVRQFVASGDKPAAILWFPVDVAASVNSVRQLSQIAPVIQLTRAPIPATEPYVTSSVSGDSLKVGAAAEALLAKARSDLEAKGVALKSPQGNLLRIFGPATSQTAIDRTKGFMDAMASKPFTILATEAGVYAAAQPTYVAASPLIARFRGQIDFLQTYTTDAAVGVAQALRENGLELNKDVWMVADACNGGVSALADRQILGTTIQSPQAEGQLGVVVAAQFLATQKTVPGDVQYPVAADPPAFTADPPHKVNYIPLLTVTDIDQFNAAKIWGRSAKEMCS
ncbi:hypothetical protein GCM10009836_60700 [Pseudonocardia ailaonensis]|uniref:Periplasmic binding protein domain-containing protein n=1 Tax=Pseudonocardia ailaonensis TaxID=367279 RepID=A0ABN2NKF4_9PSEU